MTHFHAVVHRQAGNRRHLKVAMITGDNARTARAIAARLGIDEVVAEVLPDGKVDAVRRLRSQHGKVAYVGDGIQRRSRAGGSRALASPSGPAPISPSRLRMSS